MHKTRSREWGHRSNGAGRGGQTGYAEGDRNSKEGNDRMTGECLARPREVRCSTRPCPFRLATEIAHAFIGCGARWNVQLMSRSTDRSSVLDKQDSIRAGVPCRLSRTGEANAVGVWDRLRWGGSVGHLVGPLPTAPSCGTHNSVFTSVECFGSVRTFPVCAAT